MRDINSDRVIYHNVFNQVSDMVRNNIVNAPLAQPLAGAEIKDLAAAAKAYKALHTEFQNGLYNYPTLFASYAPVIITSLVMNSCGLILCSKANREMALRYSRFSAMQQEKNTVANIYIDLIVSSGVIRAPEVSEREVKNIEWAATALAGVRNQIHNCISISTLVVFALRARGIPAEHIEQFERPKTGRDFDPDAHAFVVINRAKGSNAKDMSTWGKECYIIDPWYGYCGKAQDLCKDEARFSKYYLLLNLEHKSSAPCTYSPLVLAHYTKEINQALPAQLRMPVVPAVMRMN